MRSARWPNEWSAMRLAGSSELPTSSRRDGVDPAGQHVSLAGQRHRRLAIEARTRPSVWPASTKTKIWSGLPRRAVGPLQVMRQRRTLDWIAIRRPTRSRLASPASSVLVGGGAGRPPNGPVCGHMKDYRTAVRRRQFPVPNRRGARFRTGSFVQGSASVQPAHRGDLHRVSPAQLGEGPAHAPRPMSAALGAQRSVPLGADWYGALPKGTGRRDQRAWDRRSL